MADLARHWGWNFGSRAAIAPLVMTVMLTLASVMAAQAFTIIHNFTGTPPDGASPMAGLTLDAAGDLFGTAESGGVGYGTVFELKHTGSGYIYRPLYNFAGGNDGDSPLARVVIGPNGSLYGTTLKGGGTTPPFGVGIVFNLQPPITACKAAFCPWLETVLVRFNEANGANPYSEVTFDRAGNMYGTTYTGGERDEGEVYELSPSNGGWSFSFAYSFLGQGDGRQPVSGVIFDNAGNLYGTARFSGKYGNGTVYQLTSSGQSWTENTLYSFQGAADGGWPEAGVVVDSSGNLFGSTPWFPDNGQPGTVYQLTPYGGGWAYSLLYPFPQQGYEGAGAVNTLVMDKDGNLYGTTSYDGIVNDSCHYGCGTVFKLSPSAGGWIYTDLHDFTGGSGGAFPYAGVVLDSQGNVYGTTSAGGTGTDCYDGDMFGCGTVWEITP